MPQLPVGWKETTLGAVIEFQRGFDLPINKREKWEFPLITSNGINDYINQFKVIGPGVITGRSWTLGNVMFINDNFRPLNTTLWVKNFNNNDEKFIYYWLSIFSFEKYNSGSGVPSLNRNHIHQFIVHFPENKKEQQAIAAVLSSFDDKIELLRAENQTLEQMGQELFKEWFGKWKVGDDLPEGWRVGKLGEMISLQWWFVHNINLVGWEKTKIAKMWVVDGKTFFNRNSVIGYSDIIPEKHKLEEWDLIICTRDVTQDRLVIWNVALVPDDLVKFWLYAWSNTWIVKTSFHKLFLFLLFRSKSFRNHIIQSAKGSTIVMITQDVFLETNIIIPDQETLSQFDLVMKPLFNKISANSEQIQTLSATRDQLLPKLMSGEVRVEF